MSDVFESVDSGLFDGGFSGDTLLRSRLELLLGGELCSSPSPSSLGLNARVFNGEEEPTCNRRDRRRELDSGVGTEVETSDILRLF